MPEVSTQEQMARLGEIIRARKGQKGALMTTLQEAQSLFGHVSKDVQQVIAEGLGVTLSEVYGVATFYSQFSLEPRGKYVVGVCMGTACYVKGAKAILDRFVEELGIQVGETTPNMKFTIKDTRCLGACGLAPVIMINDDVYGRLTPDDVPGIVAKYRDL